MELIESETESQGPLPEPELRPKTAALPIEKNQRGQTWLRILAAILIGLVLVVLIVLLARWIYHKSHHSVQTPPATSLKSGDQSNLKVSGGDQSQDISGSTSKTGSSNASTPPSNSPGSPQITNTGPGDVVAMFVGTSLAAAGLHFIVSLRRQTQ
jgi:hypothetical protein